MKRNFLFTLVGIIVMLTSCNAEEVGSLATNKTTSFNVSVDDGVKTRAGNAVTDLTRYVMEIYKGATATGTPEMHKEQATGVFTDILLDNAQEYTVLFWADYGTPSADGTHNAANEYNAADLKIAKVAKQPTKAAYAGVSKFTVGTTAESAYTNVELKHAVAQVNFVQTEKLTSATNTLTVSYPESYSMNVEDNAVTKIDGVVTHNFTYNNDVAGTLGTSYIIGATGAPKTVLEITATLNSEIAIAVSNVPFERNFRTNISGAYSSKYSAVLTVTCSSDWGTPDNEEVCPDFIEVNGLKVAIGNLVSNGAKGARIGKPINSGLFFKFGSLIGWTSTTPLEIIAKPTNFTGNTSWTDAGMVWKGTTGTVPFTVVDSGSDDEKAGIGDPCSYYLKGGWRLPTLNDLGKIFSNASGWTGATGWSWSGSFASHTSGLTLPAAGSVNGSGVLRNKDVMAEYWGAWPVSTTAGGGYLLSQLYFMVMEFNRGLVNGAPVRCVRD